MLVAPVPAPLATFSRTITFVAWDVQGEADGARIRGFYLYLEGTMDTNKDEMLVKIASSEEGADISFLLYVKDADG